MSSSSFDPKKPVQSVQKPGVSQTVDANPVVPHVVTPEGAILVKRAEGEFGDKVAIAGFSVSNFGLFGASQQGTGLFASGTLAAEFEGTVKVTGDVRTSGSLIVGGDIQLSGADYAEDFDVRNARDARPGTVMVLDDAGGVRISDTAYDQRVAGVVSGAGTHRPAVILDRHDTASPRRPLALMGKVYCMVDASHEPIAIGDLLTTSATPGHAMKASDRTLAFGAVIGKALQPLPGGRGLVPILVALQ